VSAGTDVDLKGKAFVTLVTEAFVGAVVNDWGQNSNNNKFYKRYKKTYTKKIK